MQEISAQLDRPRWSLTVSFWIVLGGVALYFVASFLPLFWVNFTGVAEPENLWSVAFGDQFEVIGDFRTFIGVLAMILIALSLIIQLFVRRGKRVFMIINLVLSGAVVVSIARIAWIYLGWEASRARILKDSGVHSNFGVMALGVGFYLLLIALLVVVAGSIVGLARKRREEAALRQ